MQEYVAPPPKKGFGNVFKRRDSKGKPRLPWEGEGVEIDDDVFVLKWESDDARRIEDISQGRRSFFVWLIPFFRFRSRFLYPST